MYINNNFMKLQSFQDSFLHYTEVCYFISDGQADQKQENLAEISAFSLHLSI